MKYVLAHLILLAGTLCAQQTRYVIVIVLDGVRYTETFGDSTHQWIPGVWTYLRPQGTIYTSFFNAGLTETNPGHASIATGAWQTISNDGSARPHTPTVFEYFRKSLGSGVDRNYVVLGKTKLGILAYSDHPEYGPSFGASIASTPSQNDDGLAAVTLQQVLSTCHPYLTILNLPHADSVAHGGSWDGYVSSIRGADSLICEIWNSVQTDSVMRGKTTMFVTGDHGRHTTSFTGHGDGCEGCRHLMLLAIGPDTPPGAVDSTPRMQIDIAPTIGLLLGFGTPYSAGTILGSATGTLSYAHDVVLSHPFRDSLHMTARVENPLAHLLDVVVSLRDPSGTWSDSIALHDDGLHSDGAAEDGIWGNVYTPGHDDTLRASIRVDDPTGGTSTRLADVAQFVFTRGPLIALDLGTLDIGRVPATLQTRDTVFMVRNVGFSPDSLAITVDPINVVPDTAITVSPLTFYLAAKDSQEVRFRIRPQLLVPQYYIAELTVVPRAGIGHTTLSKAIMFQIVITGEVDGASRPPEVFALHQNFPNPFNPSTTIRFSLPLKSHVTLTVFNTLGQIVGVLLNDEKNAGYHEVRFSAPDLASGVYLCRMQAGSYLESRKLILVR